MKPLGERPSFQLPRKNFPKSNGETHQKLQWVLITKFQQLGWLKLEFTTKHALTVSPSHSVNQLSKLAWYWTGSWGHKTSSGKLLKPWANQDGEVTLPHHCHWWYQNPDPSNHQPSMITNGNSTRAAFPTVTSFKSFSWGCLIDGV